MTARGLMCSGTLRALVLLAASVAPAASSGQALPSVDPVSYAGPPVRTTPTPFPVPPAQGRPWEPPEGTPQEMVDAAHAYFDDMAMPDPRGLPLYRVTLDVGNNHTGRAIRVNTAGWLLPGESADGRRFVIAPNGFLYAADSVYERLDVADYASAVERPVQATPSLRWSGFFPPSTEERAIRCRSRGTRSLLLLRAGYSPTQPPVESEFAGVPWIERPPYACDTERVSPWSAGSPGPAVVWRRWDRAVGAYRRGDDALALHDIRLFRRQLREQEDDLHPWQAAWTRVSQALLGEVTRRTEEAGHPRLGNHSGAEAGSAEARVTKLIQGLEEVNVSRDVNDYLASDKRIAELVRIGAPAVEPLLTCMERDRRLTRTVWVGEQQIAIGSVVSVGQAAGVALGLILDPDSGGQFAVSADPGRVLDAGEIRAIAPQIREYWQRYAHLPRPERWYAMLMDEDAEPARWVEASLEIVGHDRRAHFYQAGTDSLFPIAPTAQAWRGAHRPFRGEALRGRALSVSELMSRRLDQLHAPPRHDRHWGDTPEPACELAYSLAVWDFQAGKAALSRFLDRCYEANSCACAPYLASALVDELDVRRRYEGWLLGLTPNAHVLGDIIGATSRNPRDDRLLQILEHVLQNPAWRDLLLLQSLGRQELRLEPVREAVLAALRDHSRVGTLVGGADFCGLSIGGRYQGGESVQLIPARQRIPVRAAEPLRRADRFADSLARTQGRPSFAMCASLRYRNRSIRRLITWVQSFAHPVASPAPAP